MPDRALHRVSLTSLGLRRLYWIGDLWVFVHQEGRLWQLGGLLDGKRWLDRQGVDEERFATRKAAVETVLALHAVDPAPAFSCGENVKLRRAGKGTARTRDGRYVATRDTDGRWALNTEAQYLGTYDTLRFAQIAVAKIDAAPPSAKARLTARRAARAAAT